MLITDEYNNEFTLPEPGRNWCVTYQSENKKDNNIIVRIASVETDGKIITELTD